MRTIAMCLAVTLLACASVHGAVATEISMSVVLYPLNDASGGAAANPMKTVAVVDKDRDGLAGFGLSDAAPYTDDAPTDTFLFDANDWLVEGTVGGVFKEWEKSQETGQLGFNDYLESELYKFALDFAGDTPLSGADYVDAGDPLFLFWFPTLRAGDAVPGPDAPFGVLNLGGLPAAGQSKGFSDADAVGNRDAVYSTAPEPATMVLMLLGGGLMALRRRRHA